MLREGPNYVKEKKSIKDLDKPPPPALPLTPPPSLSLSLGSGGIKETVLVRGGGGGWGRTKRNKLPKHRPPESCDAGPTQGVRWYHHLRRRPHSWGKKRREVGGYPGGDRTKQINTKPKQSKTTDQNKAKQSKTTDQSKAKQTTDQSKAKQLTKAKQSKTTDQSKAKQNN